MEQSSIDSPHGCVEPQDVPRGRRRIRGGKTSKKTSSSVSRSRISRASTENSRSPSPVGAVSVVNTGCAPRASRRCSTAHNTVVVLYHYDSFRSINNMDDVINHYQVDSTVDAVKTPEQLLQEALEEVGTAMVGTGQSAGKGFVPRGNNAK